MRPLITNTGALGEVELGQLFRDGVEPLNRAAVIVLVMADDQPLRHAVDRGRLAGERLYFIGHLCSSGQSSGVIAIVSKWVTLSALVHSATLPRPANVLSFSREQRLAVIGDVEAVPFGLHCRAYATIGGDLDVGPGQLLPPAFNDPEKRTLSSSALARTT